MSTKICAKVKFIFSLIASEFFYIILLQEIIGYFILEG